MPPTVSIIIPCYNEQATIGPCLNAIYAQTFPRSELEVIIADGLSTDGTRSQINAFQQAHPDLLIKIIKNTRRIIPAALNRAIGAASGKYIVRLDGHSLPYPDYVEHCVAGLERGSGENVGGVWEIYPGAHTGIARAIAAAAAHPLGVGDAHYRHTDRAQAVDTVPFGAFRRSLVDRVGWFDESLLTNEDYEFMVRIRKAGGVVWLDPAIRSIYYARPTLRELSRQYWRYGYWKAQMLLRYPKTLRWRQALPPLFVISLVGLSILAFLPIARWFLAAEIVLYLLILLAVGVQLTLKQRDRAFWWGVPLAIGTMHITWGTALLWGLIQSFGLGKR